MTRHSLLAAALAAALAFSASAALAADDQKPEDSKAFVKTAIQHNYAEVDVGKLAQEKGKDPAVKSFGAMLVTDHGENNVKAKQVAQGLGVDPPTSADMMHQASYLKLKILSGGTFDKSFIDDMIDDHKADIAKFEKQAMQNDATGAYAKETLPALKKHLAEAQKIQQQMASSDSSKQTTGSGMNKSMPMNSGSSMPPMKK
jgi:putative membrane protein